MLHEVFGALWAFFWVVWMLAAIGTKRTIRRQSPASRALQGGAVVLGYVLLLRIWREAPLNLRFLPDSETVATCGLFIAVAGFGFAFWARLTLGRNWSSTVTVKEDHQLIRRGPYRIVRHPIYAGLILASLGTAIGYGRVQCLIGLLLIFFAFQMKWKTEERFMQEQFGGEYQKYRREVSAIVPGLI
jgi:protein-S-isoprenylcysteine O-methyltransferase